MSPCYENTQKILPEDTKLFGLDVSSINSWTPQSTGWLEFLILTSLLVSDYLLTHQLNRPCYFRIFHEIKHPKLGDIHHFKKPWYPFIDGIFQSINHPASLGELGDIHHL
jgi:hypothetical protein